MLDSEFRYYLADTDAGKSLHYQLRYNVYCVREQFEDQKQFPDNQEKDIYDDNSAHFLVQSRQTGDWVGAMRLVFGRTRDLPMSRVAPVDQEIVAGFDEELVAEASRLCALLPKLQNNAAPLTARTRTVIGQPSTAANQRLNISCIAVGLIRAARHYCLKHRIETCFFLINEPLARILRRLGMEIDPVGSPCQHRGWRRPYCHNFITGYQQMAKHSPELYKDFCKPTAFDYFSELEPVDEPATVAISA